MRPRERRESGEQDLFRARLDQIIDMEHALVRLARTIDWGFLETTFGAVYEAGAGRPPLPTRLMAGLAILKHTYNLSDEVVCELWLENPYYQYFCGEEFFRHRLPFDRSSMTHWRNRMGAERLQALLQESLAAATRSGAIKPADLACAVVDTTVQPKNVTFPTDAKLVNRAREKLVTLAKKLGVELRQSYARVGKLALVKHQRAIFGRLVADVKAVDCPNVIFPPTNWQSAEPTRQASNCRGGCSLPLARSMRFVYRFLRKPDRLATAMDVEADAWAM